MNANKPVSQSPTRPRHWRYFVQFSLRSLLLFMTAAAVACWWYLQPQVREEQFERTPLKLRRQIRLVEVDPANPPGTALEIVNGKPFMIVNSGHWRVLDTRGNLLVGGRYKNDQQHGRWTTYHPNGRRAAEGLMVQGKKSGPWRTWNEDEKLLSEVTYP